MPKSKRSDITSFWQLQPLHRDLVFCILCIISLAPLSYLSIRIINALIILNKPKEKRALFTQISMTIIFTLVSVLTPIISIRRLHRSRIQVVDKKRSVWSLFRLHNPHKPKHKKSAGRILSILNEFYTYKYGQHVLWDSVPKLTDEDKNYIKVVVEDCMVVKRNDDDGTIYFAERCPWLLLFSHFVLLGGILVAGTFSFEEIAKDGLETDGEIGKVLSEWMSNYVLLIVGFLQIVSRGAWFRGFSGICSGAASTMTIGQRNAMIAMYIVLSTEQIHGLRREACYSKVKMDGHKWLAPPVSSAVIAAARGDDIFSVTKSRRDDWDIDWDEYNSHLEVRMVGSTGCS